MSYLDDYGIGVSRRELGAIYRAFKAGELEGITQRDIGAIYDAFKDVTEGPSDIAFSDAVDRLREAARLIGDGDKAQAAEFVGDVVRDYLQLPDEAAAREALARAVDSGLVRVERVEGGYRLSGATYEYKDGIKGLYGAKWDAGGKSWSVTGNLPELDQAARKTEAVAAKLAKRAEKAGKAGVIATDQARAAQIRKIGRELEAVYREALADYGSSFFKLMEQYAYAEDPIEAIKLGYRRDETKAVIDALKQGLTTASAQAEAIVSGSLPETQIVARHIAAWQIDNMAGVNVSRMLGNRGAVVAVANKYDRIAWAKLQDPRAAEKALRRALARGILTGEHPTKIARRIGGVFDQWDGRALTIARTETCRATSHAQQELYREAEAVGVSLMNEWDATLDGVTRESHRKVDGERRKPGEKFGNGLKRPGDGGSAAEVVNCRCCLRPVVDGFKPDFEARYDQETGRTIPYMTYAEWERTLAPGMQP